MRKIVRIINYMYLFKALSGPYLIACFLKQLCVVFNIKHNRKRHSSKWAFEAKINRRTYSFYILKQVKLQRTFTIPILYNLLFSVVLCFKFFRNPALRIAPIQTYFLYKRKQPSRSCTVTILKAYNPGS